VYKSQVLWSLIPLWRLEIPKHNVICFVGSSCVYVVFHYTWCLCFHFLCFWVWIHVCCRWVHFGLDMVYHLGFYLLCVVCVMTLIVVGTDVVAHDIRKGREHHFTYKINALDFLFEWYYFKILYIDACDVSFKLSIDSKMLHDYITRSFKF
jgi:hypothetical protein